MYSASNSATLRVKCALRYVRPEKGVSLFGGPSCMLPKFASPPISVSSSSAHDLKSALASLPVAMDDTSAAELRERVCSFVDEMKRLDLPPERILVALKKIAHDAGLRGERITSAGVDMTPGDAVLRQLVRWCIEHYYGPGRS